MQDPKLGCPLLIIGKDNIWAWKNGTWIDKSPTSGPGPSGMFAAAAYPDRGVVLAFGGLGSQQETWSWDGATWTQLLPTGVPAARLYGHAMAYDPSRKAVLMQGGTTSGVPPQPIVNMTDEYFNPYVAAVEVIGFGCQGSNGALRLGLKSGDLPWLGSVVNYELLNLPISNNPSFVTLGGSKSTWNAAPLPLNLTVFGMTGCWMFSALDLLIPIQNQAGKGTYAVPLGWNTWLLGRSFYVQGYAFDAGANVLGITASNSVGATIGAR